MVQLNRAEIDASAGIVGNDIALAGLDDTARAGADPRMGGADVRNAVAAIGKRLGAGNVGADVIAGDDRVVGGDTARGNGAVIEVGSHFNTAHAVAADHVSLGGIADACA